MVRADRTPAEVACLYLLTRMIHDGRVAYLLGPGSRSWELLTEAAALAEGEDVAAYRAKVSGLLRPVRVEG